MKIKNNDFIELDFVAKIKETGEIFDTSSEEEAKREGLFQENEKARFKPLKICVGQGMVVRGFDKAIEGKEAGKEYEIELKPEEAFGKRDNKLVRIMPVSAFKERGLEPVAGMMLALDNFLVKICAVTSGRVIVDFNNPLSGRHLVYKFKINNLIGDLREQLLILSKLFIGIEPEINIENKKAIISLNVKLPPQIEEEFKKKVREILDTEVDIKYKEDKEKQREERIEPERPYNE